MGKLPDELCEGAAAWDAHRNDSDFDQPASGVFDHTLGRPRVTAENILAGMKQPDTVGDLLKGLRNP